MEKMLTLIFVFLILKLPLILCSLEDNSCFWRTKQSRDYEEDRDNECIFIIHVKGPKDNLYYLPFSKHFPPEKYGLGLALEYAIDEINKNPRLLPNVSLGFNLYSDMCDLKGFYRTFSLGTENVFNWFPNYMCIRILCEVIISGEKWTTSSRSAPMLQMAYTPQLIYGPFQPMLIDHKKFPYLHHMGTKDTSLTLALVSLMIHFTWKWVGLVISDDDQGLQFLSDLREEMQRNGICCAFVNVVPVSDQLYLTRTGVYYNQIMTSSATVIITYGDMSSILSETSRTWQYLGPGKIWVTTIQWDAVSRKIAFNPDLFHRTFTLSQHHADVYGLQKFIQTLKSPMYLEDISLEKLGWLYFNCSVSESQLKNLFNLSTNVSLGLFTQHTFDVAMGEESYNLYNAAYVAAHSLHELLLQQVDLTLMIIDNSPQSDCRKLNHLLKNMQFTNPVGDLVTMNQKGKLDPEYDIFSFWDFQESLQVKVKIGHFSPHLPQGQQLQLLDDMIEWTTGSRQIPASVCSVTCIPGFRKSHQEGKAACCFDCTPCSENEISNETDMEQCVECPEDHYANTEHTHCLQRAITFLAFGEPLGMALACTALCFCTLTSLVLGVFVKHHDTPIVRANNRTLSYILLISLAFCFLCSLLFLGHPNTATCILQQTTFGVVFTVAVSTVLAKTITVVLAFKLTTPTKRMRWLLVSGAPNFIIPICILIQLILCGVWLGTSPPFIETDSHSEHGHIIIVCNKGSVTAFYCVLGFLGSLALGSFTIAFFARKLPDKYNEAKFLTFSMLMFCSVWVTFLPVYHSTKGKVMVAVEVFSILASSAGLLGCIFVPKCYVIFLSPERNSLPKCRDRMLA